MRRTVFVISFALALTLLCSTGAEVNAVTCPTVSCPSGGTNNGDICNDNFDDTTTFSCTFVGTFSDGSIHTTVAYLTFDCEGNVTAYQATSNTNTGGSTFSDWASQGTTTYCIKSDDTGYIFPPTAASCPISIVLDASQSEIRALDTTPDRAQVGVCEQD